MSDERPTIGAFIFWICFLLFLWAAVAAIAVYEKATGGAR